MVNQDIETVAPDGDVVLVVGPPHKKRPRKMRVCASTLSAVSPVFKALFGPHFSEGQQARNAADPVEIQLPDDNYRAVLHLCLMAHLVYIDRGVAVGAVSLVDLAVAVDKYCCVEPLKLQCSALLYKWIIDNMGQVTSEEVLWRLISAAYLMDCPQAFEMLTSKLITHTWGRLEFLSTDRLPLSVTGALAEKRSAAQRKFCNRLADLGISNWWHNCGCATQPRDFVHKLAQSFDLPFWPPNFDTPGHSLQVLLEKTRSLPGWKHSDYSSCGRVEFDQGVSSQRFREAADGVAAACAGLCLACAKASSISMGSRCEVHRAKQAMPAR